MNIIYNLYSTLLRILPYQRIPKLPRGMLSAEYLTFDEDTRRVIARLGSRDPRGVKVAMKKYDAETVDELVGKLEHHRVSREFHRRLNDLLCHWTNSTNYDPNGEALARDARRERAGQKPMNAELKRRLNRVLEDL